jgi:hypothetical protein
VTGPNGAGDRAPAGVFARVRRDRQITNLLYRLLGYDDETDPERALESLATAAAEVLDVCGREYRVRVIRALQLLTGLVLDAAENATPAAVEARCENVSHSGFGARLCDDCDEDRQRAVATPHMTAVEPAPCPTCAHRDGGHATTCADRDTL